MGDQDQVNEQQDSQEQADAQTPPGDGNQTRSQTDGQSGDAGQRNDPGRDSQASQGTTTPGVTAGGYKLSLTEAQRKKLVEEGVLELSNEQYTGGVRQQVETLRKRATTAEKKLGDIAAAQAEADRKALEEQNRFKELYEQERQAREAESAARKDDLVRSRFLLAAQSKGFVDPDSAFLIAKSLPEFGAVAADDAGAVSGLDEMIETLAKEKPYLIAQLQQKAQSVGSASNPAPQTPPAPKSLSEAGDRLEQALRTGVSYPRLYYHVRYDRTGNSAPMLGFRCVDSLSKCSPPRTPGAVRWREVSLTASFPPPSSPGGTVSLRFEALSAEGASPLLLASVGVSWAFRPSSKMWTRWPRLDAKSPLNWPFPSLFL